MDHTNVERQRRFRERQYAERGLVSLTVYVPSEQAADIREALSELARDRDLELGPYRNFRTGKLVKRRKS